MKKLHLGSFDLRFSQLSCQTAIDRRNTGIPFEYHFHRLSPFQNLNFQSIYLKSLKECRSLKSSLLALKSVHIHLSLALSIDWKHRYLQSSNLPLSLSIDVQISTQRRCHSKAIRGICCKISD